MSDLFSALEILLLLCSAAILGQAVVRRLPAVHRSRETLEHTQLVTGLLSTFTALVLSLLISSVNINFEKTDTDLRTYASQIIRLAATLDEYGPETLPMRRALRDYTASAIASTWPEEPKPAGHYPPAEIETDEFDSPNLGAMLHRLARDTRALVPVGAEQSRLQAEALARTDAILDQRWTLIGEAHSTITTPFYDMLVLWLIVVFVSFGMSAPKTRLAAAFVVLVAFSVSGVFFVILELDGPLVGLIKVSSEPLRHALKHVDQSLDAPVLDR